MRKKDFLIINKNIKKEYRLITNENQYDFTKTINKYLENGWELYGNPSMSWCGNTHYYLQGLTRNPS